MLPPPRLASGLLLAALPEAVGVEVLESDMVLLPVLLAPAPVAVPDDEPPPRALANGLLPPAKLARALVLSALVEMMLLLPVLFWPAEPLMLVPAPEPAETWLPFWTTKLL